MSPILNFEDYTIAWLAVLPIEAEAALGVLDTEHDGHFESVWGDDYVYLGGDINGHNVVIATLPAGQNYGVVSAAALANQVKCRFPNIRLALLVGVAAGLPNLSAEDPERRRDIRLGDVLVCVPGQTSVGIVQYDLGRDTGDGFSLNGRQMESPAILRSVIGRIQLRNKRPFKAGNIFSSYLADFQQKVEESKFSYPGQQNDQLYEQVLQEENLIQKLVERPARTESEPTQVWYGNIGSGNSLMRNHQRRDELRDKYNLIGLEMEAAGVMNTFPTTVIRGVCDYGDRQKNKIWQPYAAAVAAAYAKGVLCDISIKALQTEKESFKSLKVLPFGRNKDFIGRQHYVNHLIEIFCAKDADKDCQRVALDGLGGVGKTQIALELCFKIQEVSLGHSVFWVRASDAAAFERAYRVIGQRLMIPGIDEDKADVKDLVRERLSQPRAGKWLLVLDNADDFEMLYSRASDSDSSRALHEFLPFSPLGAILFTTRDHESATRYAGSCVLTIKEMNEADSLELLQAGLQNQRLIEDEKSVIKLLKLLANLPLAIMQAAAYLNAKSMTVAEYLLIYEDSSENTIKLLSNDFEERRRYPDMKNPIATTWLISFEQIRLRNSLAAEYLAFMSFIKEQDIPKNLLPAAPLLEQTEAIGLLKSFGFIKERPRGNSYDMHRLVHISMQNWLKLTNQLQVYKSKSLEWMRDAFPWPEYENRSLWTIYLPHAQCLVASSEIYVGLEEAQSDLLSSVAECCFIAGKYTVAEQLERQLLRLRKQIHGPEDPLTLDSMNNLATTLRAQSKHAEAEHLNRQVLQLRERVLGLEHPTTLVSMQNLANSLYDQGKHIEAEQLERQVLQLRKKVLGSKHPLTLDARNNSGITLLRQGKQAEAEQLGQQLLKFSKQVLRLEHPSMLDSMHSLAITLSEQGKHIEAEQLGRQVLQLKEQVLGLEHPSTLDSMNNLAITLSEQGNYTEAEQLDQKVLRLREQVLGLEHPSTLDSMHDLANSLYKQGRHIEAEQLGRQALQLREQVLGLEHPSTLDTMYNLAVTLSEQGNYIEAEHLNRQVLQLREQVLGPDHPSTLDSMNSLAIIVYMQGRHVESEQLNRQVLQLRKQVLGLEHPSTLDSMHNLATTLSRQSEYTEAEQLGRQVLQLREQILGPNHASTLESIKSLVTTLYGQDNYSEACELRESLAYRQIEKMSVQGIK